MNLSGLDILHRAYSKYHYQYLVIPDQPLEAFETFPVYNCE